MADGFFASMGSLKYCDPNLLKTDPNLSEQFCNYEHIMKICQDNHTIPLISTEKAKSILARLKKDVTDFFSVTSLHYLNAGDEGINHFKILVNAIVQEVNNATLEELNLALGLILYKGHNTDRTSDRAYRTISKC